MKGKTLKQRSPKRAQEFAEHRRKTIIFLFTILAVLVVLILIYALRTYQQFETLKEHRLYLREQNISIQSWMPIHTISKRFNIPQDAMLRELNLTNSTNNLRLPLETVCIQKQFDCTEVTRRLDGLRTQ